MSSTDRHTLRQLRQLTEIRDWDQFLSLQKLSTAFCTEVAETVELFQGFTENQRKDLLQKEVTKCNN